MEDSHPTIPELPEDIIIRILVRLPVKSLLCCKTVCKTWNQFLKTPSFISVHHKSNATVTRLLLCSSRIQEGTINHVFSFRANHRSGSVLSPDIRIPTDPDTDRVLCVASGSYKGIVCYCNNKHQTIFLSNPATRQFKQLPPTPFHLGSGPKFYQVGVAFGFDSTNSYDFKVLRLFCKQEYPNRPIYTSFHPEIFTLSSNTWKQLHWGLDDSVQLSSKRGLFCASSFHFISFLHKTQGKIIVCCDIHTESFRTMQLPSVTSIGNITSLMVFKEFLSAVCSFINCQCEGILIDIWIMKDYGVVESWTKLYSIGQPWATLGAPLCIWTVEEDALLLGLDTNELVLCHLNNQSFEPFEIQGYTYYSQIVVYQETLVSIM